MASFACGSSSPTSGPASTSWRGAELVRGLHGHRRSTGAGRAIRRARRSASPTTSGPGGWLRTSDPAPAVERRDGQLPGRVHQLREPDPGHTGPAALPIWIASNPGGFGEDPSVMDRPLRRVVEMADGWMTVELPPVGSRRAGRRSSSSPRKPAGRRGVPQHPLPQHQHQPRIARRRWTRRSSSWTSTTAQGLPDAGGEGVDGDGLSRRSARSSSDR